MNKTDNAEGGIPTDEAHDARSPKDKDSKKSNEDGKRLPNDLSSHRTIATDGESDKSAEVGKNHQISVRKEGFGIVFFPQDVHDKVHHSDDVAENEPAFGGFQNFLHN